MLLSRIPELARGIPCVLLEIFAKIRYGRKIQSVGDFADGKQRCLEHTLGVQYGVSFYPFHCILACNRFDCKVDMLGRKAENAGIESHVTVDVAVFPDQFEEPVCYLIVS